MFAKVKVDALSCQCNICGYPWVTIALKPPINCANQECRSREWNGHKTKRKPDTGIKLPKPVRVKEAEADE